MEATQEGVGAIAAVVTMATFVGSMSMTYRIWHTRNPSRVAFAPLVMATICMNASMLHGRAAGDSNRMRKACCVAVMAVLSPILRIRQKTPLPVIATWTLTTCGLWALYAVLSWDVWLFLANFVGVLGAAAELILAVWMWWRSGDDLAA